MKKKKKHKIYGEDEEKIKCIHICFSAQCDIDEEKLKTEKNKNKEYTKKVESFP